MNHEFSRSIAGAQAPMRCATLHPYGPFVPDIDLAERVARLRSLRMCVILMFRSRTDLIDALTLAENGDVEWLTRADAELQRLPALYRRRLLASYANLFGSKKP